MASSKTEKSKRKLLVPTQSGDIAPRFDLATEVLLVSVGEGRGGRKSRTMLLPGPSADELCGLALKEKVGVVICGGIAEEHYQFLCWKNIEVIEKVIGNSQDVLDQWQVGALVSGAVVKPAGKV